MLSSRIKQIVVLFTLVWIFTGCGDKITTMTGSTPAPDAPQDVQAVAADGQVTVSWRPAANATSYVIYWKLSSGVTSTDNAVASASSFFVHQGLANGTACYYAVSSVNAGGESGLSAEISATPVADAVPSAPENVLLSAADNRISVSWDPVPGALYYNIYWAAAAGVSATSNRIATNQIPYAHEGLALTTTYYYRVSAVNSAGEGVLSSEVSSAARQKYSRMLQKVMAGDAQAGDYFGSAVSLSGDYAIVTANGEDGGLGNPRLDAGAAYIFHRTGPGTWDNGVKIIAPDAQASDHFGNSVSLSGDYAIVGAPWENGGAGDPISGAGAAYIFHRTGPNTWDSGVKIVAPDAQIDDFFGYSVSISGDYAIVGAIYEDGGPGDPRYDAGAAYIFHRTGTNTWDSGVKIVAPDAQASDYFGGSVSISGDYAVAGAAYEAGGSGDPLFAAGAAYVFHRTGTNTWDGGTKLVAPDAQADDNFGWSVAISGDYVIAGAYIESGGPGNPIFSTGAAYIFHRTGTNVWDSGVKLMAPDAQPNDYFGYSVSISGDAAIVGAYMEDGGAGSPTSGSGAAYLFQRTGLNAWDSGTKLVAPDAQATDNFGMSVSIDGGYALVGAPQEDGGPGDAVFNGGAAYFY